VAILLLPFRKEEVLGLGRLRLVIRRMSQLGMKPWFQKPKVSC
jgi:hypothetical protein